MLNEEHLNELLLVALRIKNLTLIILADLVSGGTVFTSNTLIDLFVAVGTACECSATTL